MENLSSILQILKLYTHEQKIPQTTEFLKFLSTLPVPLISQEQIDQFTSLYEESHDLLASLGIFCDIFKYDSDSLKKVLLLNQDNIGNLSIKAAPYIYMNGISFILTSNINTFIDDFSLILDSIFSLTFCDYNNAFFLYFLILHNSIERGASLINRNIVKLICCHLCLHKRANIHSYNLLIEILQKIPSSESCLDKIFSTFSVLIQNLINFDYDFDVSYICQKVLSLIERKEIKTEEFDLLFILSKMKRNDNVENIFRFLPLKIDKFMSDKKVKQFTIDSKQDIEFSQGEQFDSDIEFHTFDIESSGFLNSKNWPTFQPDNDFPLNMFDSSVYNFLNQIIKLLPNEAHRSYVETFFSNYQNQIKKNPSLNFSLAFAYILTKFKCHVDISDDVTEFLFNETLFQSDVTIFNKSCDELFQLRNCILKIAYQHSKFGATSLFKRCEKRPFIFCELLLRSSFFDVYKLFNDVFLISFSRLYFSILEYDIANSIDNYNSLRIIFYSFLKKLLKIPSLPYDYIQKDETAEIILNTIYEKSFRSTVSFEIKNHLCSNRYSEINHACYIIGNLIKLSIKAPQINQNLDDFLKLLIDNLKQNSFISSFSINIINSLLMLIEKSDKYTLQILKILFYINQIDESIYHRLLNVLIKTELTDSIIDSLFSLLSNSYSKEHKYLISNGEMIHLILAVFAHFKRAEECLLIINKLCDYSVSNRIRLHNCHFDQMLLEIFIHFPKSVVYKECQICNINESILPIAFEVFGKISMSNSNHLVAEKVMKVICHSAISNRFIGFLRPLLSWSNKYLTTKYPLGIQHWYFEADNINYDLIKKGLSINFWLYIDQPMSQLLKIESTVISSRNFFQIHVFRNTLTVINSNNDRLLTVTVPFNNWNSIILNLKDNKAYFCINDDYVSDTVDLNSTNPVVSFTFGNDIKHDFSYDDLIALYNLSKFSIYSRELTKTDVQLIMNNQLEMDPLFAFPINPSRPPSQQCTMYIDMNGLVPRLENICASLRYSYPIESIVPLFAQLQDIPNRIEVLRIIGTIYQSKFSAISELINFMLLNHKSSIFTFDLYLVFYEFLNSASPKDTYFDSLIINCELWAGSPNSDLIKIVDHWKNIVLKDYPSLFQREEFVLNFLSQIRSYFYISSEAFHIQRDENIDINFIVTQCMDILLKSAQTKFDKSQSIQLLKSIIKSDDVQLNERIINYLPAFMSLSSDVSFEIIQLILCIDFEKYQSCLHNLILALSSASSNDFQKAVILLGYDFSNQFQLSLVENDLVNFPELSSLCLMTAIQGTENDQKKIADLLSALIVDKERQHVVASIPMWFVWPVLFALQTQQIELISFYIVYVLMSRFSLNLLDQIFSFIDLLCVQTSFNGQTLKCIIIKILLETAGHDANFVNTMIPFGFEALFFTCSKTCRSNELLELYENSVFNTEPQPIHFNKHKKSKICSFKDLKEIFQVDSISFIYNLALRDESTFSKLVNSFYQIYMNLIRKVEHRDQYLQSMFCILAKYSKENTEMKSFIHKCIYNNYGKLTLCFNLVTNRTKIFFKQLKKFFRAHEKQLNEIPELKASIVDPIIEINQLKEKKDEVHLVNIRSILKHFVYPRALFDADCFVWKRDFFQTPDFVSIKLKRSLVLPSKYQYVNNEIPDEIDDSNKKVATHANSSVSLSTRLKNTFSSATKRVSQYLLKSSSSPSVSNDPPAIPLPYTLPISAIASYNATLIKITHRVFITLYISQSKIGIVSQKKLKTISMKDIRDIITRSRCQKKTALEFFLVNGKSYLVDFSPVLASTVIDQFKKESLSNIRYLVGDNVSQFIESNFLVQNWQIGQMTSFDFLLKLNIFSGRSYHDTESYILFPWVVQSESSERLRDFSRPMAAQTDQKIQYYKKILSTTDHASADMVHFVFGSAPSNAMLLSYYFVRIQPFTSLHIKIHDGHFDVADRMFKSIDNFFSGLLSSDDSRESCPEFYSMPEMFLDLSNLKVNPNDKGMSFGDLIVPQQENNSVYNYVYKLRKILEGPDVSDHLNRWIDIMFGVAQKGQQALDICNLFMPYLYDDVWKENPKKEEEEMIRTLLSSLGSIPPVVFNSHIRSRFLYPKPKQKKQVIRINYPQQIRKGFTFMSGNNSFTLIAIDCSGSILKMNINADHDGKQELLDVRFLNPSSTIITLLHSKTVYILDGKNTTVTAISTKEIKTDKSQNFDQVDFVDSGIKSNNFFTINRNGSVNLWNSHKINSPITVIQTFSDSLRCATVSQYFAVLVCGTNDGYCDIYSINNERFINSIFLGGLSAQKIIVTQKLGLVVIKTITDIWIATINGFVIKKIRFEPQFTEWITWSSKEGLDYIAGSDVDGKIWCFEAYNPEKAVVVEHCYDLVVGLQYDDSIQCFLAVTMKPVLHIISV